MDGTKRPNSYRFINNRDCQFFPCHPTDDPDNFNCLFCYCPLYALGDKCGGNFKYINKYGYVLKDCSDCKIPHIPENYEYITGKYEEIRELAAENHTPGFREV